MGRTSDTDPELLTPLRRAGTEKRAQPSGNGHVTGTSGAPASGRARAASPTPGWWDAQRRRACKHCRVTSFAPGERAWRQRLGRLRNVVRQEVIARQIAPLVGRGATVLDVGCGQGTQALRLARSGCQVTAVDPSPDLLGVCGESAVASHLDVELVQGKIEDLGQLCGHRTFDLVCCHGVMMYLDDWTNAIAELAGRLTAGGRLSVTFRNAQSLAMRPGVRGEWGAALSAFDSVTYVNELGLPARAHRTPEIEAALYGAGLRLVTWFGVRVFTDGAGVDAPLPDPDTLALLLEAEERAGATEPYKWMASQLHVVAESAP
jgi:SAM-dependent methyltransferase